MAFKHKYFMVGEIDKVMNIFVVIGLQHSMQRMNKSSFDLSYFPAKFQHTLLLLCKAASIETVGKVSFKIWKKDNIWPIYCISRNLLSQPEILPKYMRVLLEVITDLFNLTLNFLHFLLLFHQLQLPLISLLCLSMLEYINLIFQFMLQFFILSSVFSHFLLFRCSLHLQRSIFPLHFMNFRSQHHILILKRRNNFRILIIDIHHGRWGIRSNGLSPNPSI